VARIETMRSSFVAVHFGRPQGSRLRQVGRVTMVVAQTELGERVDQQEGDLVRLREVL
jgi:hypothetical protein